MKIALLSEKYTPDIGGLAISTERLARLLSSAGHAVRVFAPTLSLPPSEKRTLSSSGVSITRFGAHKRTDDTLVDWFELVGEEHKREAFDVLHAYFLTQAGFAATYAGKYLNLPSVVSVRGNDIERATFDPSRFSHVMYALENASVVTTNASELAKKTRAFIDREIFLVPNGVDAEHFKPMDKNETLAETLGIQRSASNVVGFVGELREKKGLKNILSAYAQVNSAHPATLLIVGEVRRGEDRQDFDEFKLANPDAQIMITGHISPCSLPAYYSLIDVFVHPSLRDGMPNAVLEAMACGKAVVATPVGGVPEVIRHGENGFIVPANEAESLSSSILQLLEDETLRHRLGQSARETIQREFTLQQELSLNLNIYRSLGLTA